MTATKQQPIAGYRISDPSDPTIKPWLSETPDDNGYTSEPLYAGAAPVAVARWGVAAWMTPEGDRVVTAETMDGARKDGGASLSSLRPYTVALVRAGEPAAAAPALEAPAAPVRQVLTDAQITHLQETRVGEPSPSRPIDASDWMNFARAIEAAALAALAKCDPAWRQGQRELLQYVARRACDPALPVDVVRAAHAAIPDELAARLRKAAATLAVRHSSYSNISIAWPDEKLLKSAEGRYHQALADLDALISAIPTETKQTADRDQLDSLARKNLGALLNAFGEAQWQAGRGVPCPSIEDAFEAVISAAVDLLAAAPQAPRLGEDALHLLRRLLSNQHTLTGPEFRSELEKIVAEESARHAAAPQAPAEPSVYSDDMLAAPTVGNWIAAEEVDRLVRDLEVALHGEADAAPQASLCDIVGLAKAAADKLGRPVLAAPAAPAEGEVLVEVIGLTGSGKSAICGEIEILCRALGLDVSWPDGDPEKNMTHAEWTAAIEAYKPRVRIVERNVPRQSNGGPAK